MTPVKIQEIKQKSCGQAAESVIFSLSLWLQRSKFFPQALRIDLNTIQNGTEYVEITLLIS